MSFPKMTVEDVRELAAREGVREAHQAIGWVEVEYGEDVAKPLWDEWRRLKREEDQQLGRPAPKFLGR